MPHDELLRGARLWTGDEADAELVRVTGREKVQVVDHRVVTTHERSVAAGCLRDLQFPGSL